MTLTIKYQLTPKDQRLYLRWLWHSPLMLVCQIIIMIGLFVSFGSAIYRTSPGTFPLFSMLFILFYFLLFLVSYFVTAWLQISSMKRRDLFGPTRLSLTKKGVTRLYGQNQQNGDQYPWATFRRFRETKDLFILQFQPQTIIVPKRELPQKIQADFRSALQGYEARVYGQ